MVLDGPINGDWFEAYVSQNLVPELRPGDVVIMDNLSRHKRAAMRERIEAVGAKLLFLPPYSQDFNSIEKAFSKLKALLRKAAERTVSGLWNLISQLVDIFTPQECANYSAACGYDADLIGKRSTASIAESRRSTSRRPRRSNRPRPEFAWAPASQTC